MKGQFQQERLPQAYSQEHFFFKLTKESFGYGDSILIVIMGAFLGFWSLMSVLFMAFFMAGLFSVIMLLKTKFHKKSKFPFIPFLMAAYAGGIILNGY